MERAWSKTAVFIVLCGLLGASCKASMIGSVARKADESKGHQEPIDKESPKKPSHKQRPISALAIEHYLRARLFEQQGNLGKAIEEMRRAVVYDHASAYLHTRLGVFYAVGNQWPLVGREIRSALKIDPNYIPTLLMQAQSQGMLGSSEEAIRTYKRIIELDENRVDAYIHLSNLLLKMGGDEQALDTVKQMLKANPDSAIGTKRLAELYFERGDEEQAERYFRRVLEIQPSEISTIEALARFLERQGRYQEAIDTFVEALEFQPEHPFYMAFMARLYMKAGDQSSAQAYFDQLRAKDPRNAGYIAQIYGSLSLHSEAIQELTGLLDKNPNFHFERILLALILQDRKEYQKAIEHLNRIPKLSKYHVDAQINIGACLTSLKRFDKAIHVLDHALELCTEREKLVRIYRILGSAYIGSGRIDEGLKRLDEAIRQNPDLTDLLEPKAILLVEAGKGEQGIQLLQGAVTDHPKSVLLLYGLGALYERMGNIPMSLKTMRKVLDIDPNNYSALNFIGFTLADQNEDLGEAERLVRRALLLDPGNGAVMDSLGWVLYRKGHYPEALEYLERANDLTPGEPVIIMHVGDVHLKLGQSEKAVEYYRRALKANPTPRDRNEILGRFEKLGITP